MSGLYEIHITVDHSDGFYKLLKFTTGKKNMKVLFAISKSNNYQYMVTHFTAKDTIELAVNKALDIAQQLKNAEIKVLRTKVEMRNTINMPINIDAYNSLKSSLNNKFAFENGNPYFEFHLKVATSYQNGTNIDLDKLEQDVNDHQYAVVSYNLCSSERKPIITIRVYDTGYIDAVSYKNKVVNALKTLGYIFEDKIQEEFAVYDSNPNVDYGWIN